MSRTYLAGWHSAPNDAPATVSRGETDAYKHQDPDDDGKVPW